jgi:hypothetical protein
MIRTCIAILALVSVAPAFARSAPVRHKIVLETDPGFCMGDCDRYTLTVTDDGAARLKVYHNSSVVRRKTIRLSQAQYQRFSDKLGRFRPVGDRFLIGPEQCDGFATDLGGYHVTWTGDGPQSRLVLNDGCGGKEFVPMREVLAGAATSLGFAELPGASSGVVASTVIEPPSANR